MSTKRRSSTPVRIAVALLASSLLGVTAGQMAEAAGIAPQWSSYDDDIAEANKEKAQTQKEQAQLQSDLSETDQQIAQATLQLDALNKRLPDVQEEYRLAKERYDSAVTQQLIVAQKLEAAKQEDAQLTSDIQSGNERIAQLKKVLAEMARSAYQDSQSSASLDILLGAQDSQQFVDEYAYKDTVAGVQSSTLADLQQLAAVNRNRESRQEAVRDYIEDLKKQADALVVETEKSKQAAEEKKAEVERLVNEAEKLKDYLEAQRQKYLDQQAELEAAEAAVKAELDTLWQKKLTEEATNGTGSLVKGFLSPPTANPYITSPYGWRVHPIYHTQKLHAGTDFRAYCGTPILAAADGTVEWAKLQSGLGNQVMLYNGVVSGKVLYTSYNHLTSFAVSKGQQVTRGQVVGYAGTTGTSTACHLHFEVYVNGQTVDPMTLVADW